jgi:hypothetical protein
LQSLDRLQSKFSVKVFYTSKAVGEELEHSSVEGVYFRDQNELIDALYELSPKVLLYPNQNVRNFYALRYPGAVHVFVSHGESDKAYMFQNTIKRYDLYFASGQAAVERISSKVSSYDISKRIMKIGRPQSLDTHVPPQDFSHSPRKRILYAPTWEGVTRATRYTSIVSHGAAIVRALIDSDQYQVTYRPHPLSGSRDSDVKHANEAIKRLIEQANLAKNSANHYIDESPFGWHLGYHELLISDISAIAYDWLSTGRPLLLTEPAEKMAVVEDFPLIDKLYSIGAYDLSAVEGLIADQFREGTQHKKISDELNEYYFRQPTSQSDEYFSQSVSQAISIWEKNLVPEGFPRLSSYESRGTKLGLLRYPNFIIREAFRITGSWSTTTQLGKLETSDEIFVHLSDPFNGKSLIPSVEEALRTHQKGKRLVFVLNQVTSRLLISRLLRRPEFKSLAKEVFVVPVKNATDCEEVVARLKPSKICYLKHHPLNHMLLRLNGLDHALWRPHLDPLFIPDHTLITYDSIVKPCKLTSEYVGKLPNFSRPIICA